MISSQPSFISELYLPTFVSSLDAQDLQDIQEGLLEHDEDVGKEDFCNLLSQLLSKGRRCDYEELFDLVDISREGLINWDMFSTHLLREYYEKEDRVRQSKTPQWTSLKYIPVPHRSCICTIRLSTLSYRYCTVSKDGMMCLMDRNFKIIRTSQITTDPEQIRPKDLWITDAELMQNINKIVFCNTSKQILIYDLSNKTEFNCIYIIYGLKFIPMCLSYWSNPRKPNLAMLAFGDADGGVHVLFFANATLSLFDKPLKDSDQQICYELSIDDVTSGKFPSVTYMWYKAHTSWVRQIIYQPFLDCLMSSSTTSKDSMVLSWLGKARNDSRLSTFAISVGINGFDYHEKFCLIATAGINNHVCLWNPYVVSKPVGRLEGHVQVVLAVQFIGVESQLISFARDNVLRIWDVNNQTCLQTLTGMFPGSVTSDILIMFDEETSTLLASLNHQLVLIKKKVDQKDRVVSHSSPITDIVYNDKYGQIISVCEGSSIIVWLVSTGQKVKHIQNAHGDAEITAVTLNHSQTHILTGGTDGLIKRWDTNGNCSNILVCDERRPCEINKIIYLKRTILAFGWSKVICCFSVTGLNSLYVNPMEWKGKPNHHDDILVADFIEPKHLVTASYDGDIVFWNTSTQNSPRKITNSKNRSSMLPPISSPTRINSSKRGSARRGSSRLRCRSVSARTRPSNNLNNNVSVDNSSTKPMSPLLSNNEDSSLQVTSNHAVTSISFLQARNNRDPQNADIYSSHADGHIRFWNSLTCELVGEFIAFDQFGSIASCVDSSNTYLGAGGETGACKIWNISEYCFNSSDSDVAHSPMKSLNNSPPTVVSTFVAHIDTITCTRFIEQRNLVFFLTASCDCSIALYYFSVLVGVFGQEEHWNINDHKFLHWKVSGETKPSQGEAGSDRSDSLDPTTDFEKSLFSQEGVNESMNKSSSSHRHPKLSQNEETSNDNTEEKSESELVQGHNEVEEKESEVWDRTILGKAYQEERKQKRDRKQPYDLSEISTGIPTDKQLRSYRYLETKPMAEVADLEKPEFMIHPDKYFLKKEEKGKQEVPLAIDDLKLRHDEKTIFPKHVLDKMKQCAKMSNRPTVFNRLTKDKLRLSTRMGRQSVWQGIMKDAINKVGEE